MLTIGANARRQAKMRVFIPSYDYKKFRWNSLGLSVQKGSKFSICRVVLRGSNCRRPADRKQFFSLSAQGHLLFTKQFSILSSIWFFQ
jgi:hypothetical protein